MKKKTHAYYSLASFRPKKAKVGINGRLEAAHKIIMEISLLIMEKSWNNHGILILDFCGNPVISTRLTLHVNCVILHQKLGNTSLLNAQPMLLREKPILRN